jgi:hypothetical protein
MTDGIPGVCAGSCGPAGGPVAGVEGFLDVLAGDLVAAGYAVRVDGKQDTHAVHGAGSDFGGRGTGGQPQRQRGMAEVVGAAGLLGTVPSSGIAAVRAWCQILP